MAILSEYDRTVSKRKAIAMLQSPEGREWGRYFLIEKGKADGDFGTLLREQYEILSGVIRDLYTADAPTVSGGPR